MVGVGDDGVDEADVAPVYFYLAMSKDQ